MDLREKELGMQVNSLVDYTPKDKIFEKNQNLQMLDDNITYYHCSFVALGQAKRAEPHFLRYFATDTAFCYSADQGGLMAMVGYHASLGWLCISYNALPLVTKELAIVVIKQKGKQTLWHSLLDCSPLK